MAPTYDSSGSPRSPKNDPTAGGKSFKDAQREKRANGGKSATGKGDKDAPKKGLGLAQASTTKLRPVVDKCNVCKSTYRDQIERLIVYGMSQVEVISYMEQIGEKLSPHSMSNHVRKHMTMHDAAVRRMLEKQAEKQFENIEQVADNLLTNRAMLEVMRQKAFKAIVDDSVRIEPETALKIIDKLAADDAKLHAERVDEMVMEMNILTKTMKQIVPESMWKKIAEQFRLNLELERDRRRQLARGDG